MSKPSRFPDTLVLILGLVILAQLLTYVLPAGTYDREPDPFPEKHGAKPYQEQELVENIQSALAGR